jgi:hypothetical protein
VGTELGRIHRKSFPDPLGFGKNPSRFSDPRRRTESNRFGVLYLGSSQKVCFLETMIRDDRDGIVGHIEIAETELDERLYAEIRVREALRIVDLTGDGPVRMGIPSDVARGRTQVLARKWSVAFHEHPQRPDGIVYGSLIRAILAASVSAVRDRIENSETIDLMWRTPTLRRGIRASCPNSPAASQVPT